MKKTRSILSALTVMAMLVSVPASVSAADSVSLIAGRATAKAGEEFSVDVKLSGIPSAGMSILDFAVGFDSSILTITDVTLGAVGNTGAIEADKDTGDVFTWSVDGDQLCMLWTTGLTDSQYWMKDTTSDVFVTITGTVNASAAEGTVVPLEIAPVARETYPGSGVTNDKIVAGYIDNSNTAVYYNVLGTAGEVTVGDDAAADLYGDVDCNGVVEINDVVLLSRYVAQDATAKAPSAQGLLNADCKKDGTIDSSDITAIARYLAHLIDATELGK